MRIEVFSDLVCPWCYIGKRRLDQALAGPAGQGVDVVWRAYQLYPGIPAQGMTREAFVELRFGANGGEAVRRGREQIAREAEEAGIRMDFEAASRMPNTFDGHRLLHLARDHGVQHALAETLFRAYFEEGRDVGHREVLASAAEEHGMDRADTQAYLSSDQGVDAVRAELTRAANIGVSGVPCFVLAGTFAIPGAQTAEVMAQFITRAREKLSENA